VVDSHDIVDFGLADIFTNGNHFSNSLDSEVAIFMFPINKKQIVFVDASEERLNSDLIISQSWQLGRSLSDARLWIEMKRVNLKSHLYYWILVKSW